jgi:hypothetical protein
MDLPKCFGLRSVSRSCLALARRDGSVLKLRIGTVGVGPEPSDRSRVGDCGIQHPSRYFVYLNNKGSQAAQATVLYLCSISEPSGAPGHSAKDDRLGFGESFGQLVQAARQ